MKQILFAVIVGLFATQSFAGCALSERKLQVYFGNGMFSEKKDARHSEKILKRKTQAVLRSKSYSVSYDIAYNQNEGWLEQILQVFSLRAWF